jgi:dolichol-phosphate mannosyltransferase
VGTAHTLSIISPFFNEELTVPDFVLAIEDIRQSIFKTYGIQTEVILVDDGSRDATVQILSNCVSELENYKILCFDRNVGKEGAINEGLRNSTGEIVIVLDSDLQHPPALMIELVSYWEKGHDLVLTRNLSPRSMWLTNIPKKVWGMLFRKIVGIDISGSTDYRLVTKELVVRILEFDTPRPFFRATSYFFSSNPKIIDFEAPPRSNGRSKYSSLSLFRLGVKAITTFSVIPLQIIAVMTMIFASFSGIILTYDFFQWFLGNTPNGLFTIAFLILSSVCVILFCLSIIAEYLAKLSERNLPKMKAKNVLEPLD